MIAKPEVAVLKTEGTNCDHESVHAFEVAGARAELVHVTELRSREKKLSDFHIVMIPGGFSYGDHIASGKAFAVELQTQLRPEIEDFVHDREGLALGVCNGFQVLVRGGLLPESAKFEQTATLTVNDSGEFECREVLLRAESNRCVFIEDSEALLRLPVAHGEGKFEAPDQRLRELVENQQVVFRYADEFGVPTEAYPDNPNGSEGGIAGICDETGRILGMMPHPERRIFDHYPGKPPDGQPIFQGMVDYVKKS